MARKSRVLTDHEEIRRWAEERDAQPACVRGTGSEEDVGMIRLDFPGYSGETSLEPVEWDEWFQKFDENNLALLVEDAMASGEQSNFNKIIGRETGAARARGRKSSRSAAGATKKRSIRAGSRTRSASARASSRRARSAGTRASGSRSSRSRSTSARGSSTRSSRSRSRRAPTGKKRAQSARSNSRSRSRRRAA